MKLKHIVAALAAASSLTSVMAQSSGEGPWMLRGRAVHQNNHNSSTLPVDASVNDRSYGELDVSYFFTRNIATELAVTTPQRQTVDSQGLEVGSFKQQPWVLMLQYHFTDLPGYRPYLGAGVTYTRLSSATLPSSATIDGHSWGGALQLGVDIALDRNWSVNLDVKKLYVKSDVRVEPVQIGTYKMDPVVYGLGLGYRF